MPLHLTAEHDAAIRTHAARDYPHECCGFLIGKFETAGISVAYTTPASNDWDNLPRADQAQPSQEAQGRSTRDRFEINPGEFLKADKQARSRGLGVVGFYHSHPEGTARPSEYDRERAWARYCYVIVSVVAGQPREMRAWLLRDDRSGFDEDPFLPGSA